MGSAIVEKDVFSWWHPRRQGSCIVVLRHIYFPVIRSGRARHRRSDAQMAQQPVRALLATVDAVGNPNTCIGIPGQLKSREWLEARVDLVNQSEMSNAILGHRQRMPLDLSEER
jgi:hypothetical protein